VVSGVIGPRGAGFRRYWLAATISAIGTYAAAIALAVRTFDRTHSSPWVAALFLVEFVPPVIIGFWFGAWLDRLPSRRLLVGADLARTAVFAVLIWVTAPLAVVALALVSGLATGLFRPVVGARVPDLVEDTDLELANGALGIAENGAVLVGSAVGGAAVTAFGANAMLGVNAVSFALSALLLLTLPALARRPAAAELPEEPEDALGRRMTRGLRIAGRSPSLRAIAVCWTVVCVGIGATNAIQVPFLRGTLHGSATTVGLAFAVAGAALVLGNLVGGRLGGRDRRSLYVGVLTLMGIGWCAVAASPSAAAAVGLFFIAAFGNGVAIVINMTTVQRDAGAAVRAQAIAFLVGLTSLAVVLGGILGGALAGALTPRWPWALSGVLTLVVAVPAAIAILRPWEAEGAAMVEGSRPSA
jgi:predicted MFS family arabinose efflux permease